MLPYIQRLRINSQIAELEFGDFAFEGNGPTGKIGIGIERKALGDMLNCIDDSRYAGHQRPGMMAMYNTSILIVEGVWKPDFTSHYLMECVAQLTWRPYKYRQRMVSYSKLFRYLLSVQFSGVTVIYSRDMESTAYNVCECYHYFQKRWEDHTSLLETQRHNIPSLTGKPSLVRRWSNELEGVGVKGSMEADKIFKSAYDLANAGEEDLMKVHQIGPKLAKKIYREIRGV